jgi:tetrahydromethanopterin S-methyltransferase subunit B
MPDGTFEYTFDMVDKLERIVSHLLGECMDCKTPCNKSHPSHTGQCECCGYLQTLKNS